MLSYSENYFYLSIPGLRQKQAQYTPMNGTSTM